MTYMELHVEGERINPIVVGGDIGFVEWPDSSPINIGYKVYEDVGRFKYEWLVEWLSMDEVVDLIEALQFIVDHRVEAVESDVCLECQQEEVKEEA